MNATEERDALIRDIRKRLPFVAMEHLELADEIRRAMDIVEATPPSDPVREALEAYANPDNWSTDSWNIPAVFYGPEGVYYADPTAPARAALSALSETIAIQEKPVYERGYQAGYHAGMRAKSKGSQAPTP